MNNQEVTTETTREVTIPGVVYKIKNITESLLDAVVEIRVIDIVKGRADLNDVDNLIRELPEFKKGYNKKMTEDILRSFRGNEAVLNPGGLVVTHNK